MSRNTRILSLSVAGVCGFAVSSAFAQLTPGVLPGNVLPNPTLTIPAPAGPDPVTTQWGPSNEDSNPRPMDWHRGGNDWGVQGPPQYVFWNPVQGTELDPPPSGAALQISDQSTTAYGEWFTAAEGTNQYIPLPAASISDGTAYMQFSWEATGVQPRGEEVRVSVRYGSTGASLFSGDLGDSVAQNFEIAGGASPGVSVTPWTTVQEMLNVPAGAQTFEVTVDSGGDPSTLGTIWVDDISVSSVPEPASLAGITAGSMLLLARRRRRA